MSLGAFVHVTWMFMKPPAHKILIIYTEYITKNCLTICQDTILIQKQPVIWRTHLLHYIVRTISNIGTYCYCVLKFHQVTSLSPAQHLNIHLEKRGNSLVNETYQQRKISSKILRSIIELCRICLRVRDTLKSIENKSIYSL